MAYSNLRTNLRGDPSSIHKGVKEMAQEVARLTMLRNYPIWIMELGFWCTARHHSQFGHVGFSVPSPFLIISTSFYYSFLVLFIVFLSYNLS